MKIIFSVLHHKLCSKKVKYHFIIILKYGSMGSYYNLIRVIFILKYFLYFIGMIK